MSKLKDLLKFGQSPWYDNIERGMLLTGKFKDMIQDGIRGVTSNPTIFEKAINGSKYYDDDIARLAKEGKDAQAIYDDLTTWDIAKAADLLLDTYKSSKGADGYVSIEVSPHLAHDSEGTVAEAKRLYGKVGRANVMIKVPATAEGGEAIRQLTALGINVNVTLIFTQSHYIAISQAYICGLEERMSKGQPIDRINSVASFFISRIDSYIDRRLNDLVLKESDEARRKELTALQGEAAVAQAKVIYDHYKKIFHGPEFIKLKGKKASAQRLLMASTSTKNPDYSDVKYVEEVIGNGTVNTLPHVTMEAFLDHGKAQATLDQGLNEAKQVLSGLQSHGIPTEDIRQSIAGELQPQDIQEDGVQAFIASYDKLLKSLEEKRKRFIS